MKLFALDEYRELAGALLAGLPALELAPLHLDRFANGELYVELPTPAQGDDCAVLGTLSPPERNVAEFLLVCDTLKNVHGARAVAAILPYLAYARQDRFEAGRSLGAAWVGRLLAACGVTRVVTLDVHSPRVIALCPVPLTSVDTASLFVPALRDRLGADLTLVAPDEGALDRCRRLRDATGMDLPLAHFKKVRARDGVRSSLVGPVSARALVFDDILDTGGTLIACAEGLRAAGVREIAVAVTHGLFNGTAWQRLWGLGVDRILTTDSAGGPVPADPRIQVLPCAPALLPVLGTSLNNNNNTGARDAAA